MAEHHVGRRQVAVNDVREVHLGDLLSDHAHQRIWHPTRRRSACTASGIEILGGDVPCEMVYSSRRSGAVSAGASPSSSPSSSSPSASASPSAPPPSKNLTLLPSIHSIPSKPLMASTIRIPGTFTPDLHHPRFVSRDQQRGGRRRPRRGGEEGGTHRRHLSSALASPATRARVSEPSSVGWRYCLWNRCFSSTGTGTAPPSSAARAWRRALYIFCGGVSGSGAGTERRGGISTCCFCALRDEGGRRQEG